ncbi:hypothetical protein BJ508DRAFT_413917 [Ascobolus immersus RN42]|uniref:Lytic polysaccharide monooxygenase n=1 Tax=Ascobolus immersus RN42 TaxID=1160509 RepID=A0A3N4I9I5_ASCIM|nr:hypothetical protein BJ508DRAFT_413917 [Ascobolus immersus RN42]
MADPPPINHRNNPHFQEGGADYDYSAPLSPSGSNYPCRGHLKDLNSPRGGPVKNYSPGGTYSFTIEGQATHAGGSCQASLSFDGGNSWKVIKSYVGDCVRPQPGGDQTFRFTIPGDTPRGNAIFAWTWFNNLGNREMYMNCAVVTIGNARKRSPIPNAIPLEPLPHEGEMMNVNGTLQKRALGNTPLFLANIGNGCTTAPGTDVVFPNPGDTEYSGNPAARAPPSGNCGAGNYQGGGAVGNGAIGGGDGPVVSGGTGSDDMARIDELRRLSGKHRNDCAFWISQGFVCSAGEKTIVFRGVTAILAIFGLVVAVLA